MPSGWDLLASARRFEGEPYSTAGGRTSQTSGYKDCSGLVTAACVGVGVVPPAWATVSTGFERWCIERGGRYVSSAEAINTPGIALTVGGRSHGWVGAGPRGHIAISAGDGRGHYGTPRRSCGYPRSVGWAPFWCFSWGDFFTIPGIHHGGSITQPAPPPPQHETDSEDEDMSDTLVRWTADNLPGEWHFAVVNESGDVWHHWGPGAKNREFLFGPSGATFNAPQTPPVTKVTVARGTAGIGTRLDVFGEFAEPLFGRGEVVGHLWRNRNREPWGFEFVE